MPGQAVNEGDQRIERVNELAKRSSSAAMTLLATAAYIGISVAATSDEQLLANSTITIPLVSVGVPCRGFFFVAPLLILLLHLNLLLYEYFLAGAINRLPTDKVRQPEIARYFPSLGVVRALGWKTDWFVRWIVLCLFVLVDIAGPPLLLLLIERRYLAEHDPLLTSIHQATVFVSAAVIALFFTRSPIGRSRAPSRRRGAAIGRRIAGFVFGGVVLFVSFVALRVPDQCARGALSAWAHPFLSVAGRSIDLSHVLNPPTDLRCADFRQATLTNAKFIHCTLDGADFGGATLKGADFSFAHLAGASLQQARLSGALFDHADLSEADLRSARGVGTSFRDARLAGATLRGAALHLGFFSDADLEGAQLADARLEGSDFRGARLDGADLRFAVLHRVTNLKLRAVDARQAKLGSAQICDPQDLDLSPGHLNGYLAHADIRGAELAGDMTGPEWDGVDLEMRDLAGAAEEAGRNQKRAASALGACPERPPDDSLYDTAQLAARTWPTPETEADYDDHLASFLRDRYQILPQGAAGLATMTLNRPAPRNPRFTGALACAMDRSTASDSPYRNLPADLRNTLHNLCLAWHPATPRP